MDKSLERHGNSVGSIGNWKFPSLRPSSCHGRVRKRRILPILSLSLDSSDPRFLPSVWSMARDHLTDERTAYQVFAGKYCFSWIRMQLFVIGHLIYCEGESQRPVRSWGYGRDPNMLAVPLLDLEFNRHPIQGLFLLFLLSGRTASKLSSTRMPSQPLHRLPLSSHHFSSLAAVSASSSCGSSTSGTAAAGGLMGKCSSMAAIGRRVWPLLQAFIRDKQRKKNDKSFFWSSVQPVIGETRSMCFSNVSMTTTSVRCLF